MFNINFDYGNNTQNSFTPWGDMMNNYRYPTVHYAFEDAEQAMVFRAKRDIEIGDELFDTYDG